MLHNIFVITLTVLTLLTAGCGANLAPVLNVEGAPATLPHGVQPSAGVVRDGILRGLARKGWGVNSEEGQSLLASVQAGGHSATVRIEYTDSAYSISYVDSSPGLKYDGQVIHRRYNHWIDRLRVAINAALLNSPAGAAAAPAPASQEPATASQEPPTASQEPATASQEPATASSPATQP